MAPTKAEWASLGAGATQCGESASAIQSAISGMMSTLDGITWRGAAATAFTTAKTHVQQDTTTIVNRLNAIGEGISKTSSSLMAVDEEAKQSLDSVTGGTETTGSVAMGLRA